MKHYRRHHSADAHDTYARTVLETYGMADARPENIPADFESIQVTEEESLSSEDTTH